MGRIARLALGATFVLTALAGAGAGREMLRGPYEARVIRVIDGDTLRVRARIWLGTEVEIDVRLAGIDTPELNGRCAAERRDGEAARRALAALLSDRRVHLYDVRYGKFAGRIVARVVSSRGRDVAAVLLARGLARAYDGSRRGEWCRRPAGDVGR